MEPRDKAIELVDKFSKDFQYVFSDIISKKHALIAVNEILELIDGFDLELTFNYYLEVKKEILTIKTK